MCTRTSRATPACSKVSSPSVSVTPGPKVLLWILDGCSVQAFLDVAERNRDLGTFYEEGYFAQCVTIFPSITPAAHSTIMTGCYPSKTRVPAFDWVEVKTGYSGAERREYIRCMPDRAIRPHRRKPPMIYGSNSLACTIRPTHTQLCERRRFKSRPVHQLHAME